jgi:23S rRNA (guanine2445-N2)-methyltransferase / 23S rRNA (guanine2069-N7)-methyltransferase
MSRRAPASDAARLRAVKRRIWNAPQRFRVSCALGIETLLAGEMRALPGVTDLTSAPGVVHATGPFDLAYAALLRLRSADAVRIRIGDEAAVTFPMLRDHLARLDWSLWLPRRCRLDVRVRSRASRLRDDDGIEHTLRQAVRDHGVDDRAGDDAPDAAVRIELSHDRATVWLDAAGAPLHRRSGTRWTAPTSLRETTAAALCLMGVPRDADLIVDPFCGSGTLLEEAASWLDDACPGARRDFALAASPAWKEARMRHARRTLCPDGPPSPATLVGSDVDEEALAAAHANLERAGLEARVTLSRTDARDVDLAARVEGSGARRPLLLSNPPYGRRAEAIGAAPEALLAQVLAGAAGWSFALAFPEADAIARVPGVTIERVLPIRMRGLPNALVTGRIAGGESARPRGLDGR